MTPSPAVLRRIAAAGLLLVLATSGAPAPRRAQQDRACPTVRTAARPAAAKPKAKARASATVRATVMPTRMDPLMAL